MSSYLRLSANDIASSAILLGTPSFVRPGKARGAKAAGLRYERKILDAFSAEHLHFIRSPWFRYTLRTMAGRHYYAQPDGLFVDVARGRITIVEIKYQHVVDAYFQLIDKYIPIVRKFFGDELWQYSVLEVVQWFDPHVQFPAKPFLVDTFQDARPGTFNVLIAQPH